jgi:nucleoid-associated protein YgaU
MATKGGTNIVSYTNTGNTWDANKTKKKITTTTTKPKPSPPKTSNPTQKKADKKTQEREFNLEGTAQVLIPNPHLKARRAMNFLGLGKLFSGEYRVTTVTHVINTSGYDQTLDVKRNAFGIIDQPSKTVNSGRKDPVKLEKIPEDGYIIKKGDTLWRLAQRFYGDGSKYTKIVKANNIKNPNSLQVGKKIIIPK